MRLVEFENLTTSDLHVNCIYKGGSAPNISAEPFHLLIPNCENSGGFRKKKRNDKSGKYAYIVLYTSMEEKEWPDDYDTETSIFKYYGDNRKPNNDITNTKKKGNKILKEAFELLNSNDSLVDMPPFFVFKKVGNGRDVQFLGLAAPGNPNISPGNDLIKILRQNNDGDYYNYESYFTILNTGNDPIKREWIVSLINNHENNLELAPQAWRSFVNKGRKGIVPLCDFEKEVSDYDLSTFTEELQQFEQIHSGKVKVYTDEELKEKENEEFDYSKVTSSSTSNRIPTDDRLKATCLDKAGYLCEINREHITFTNTSGIHPYMECHHLIPVKAQKYFPKLKLDSMFNLVSLCPICHAQMHYGDSKAKAKVFWDIYEKRNKLFIEKGIDEKKMKEIFERFY